VAARSRRVGWAASASLALDEVLRDIARDSPNGAIRVLKKVLEGAESPATLADRGRVVPEVGDEDVRELFVFKYRLLSSSRRSCGGRGVPS
jgi:plasmid stabilization system protein ParE